MLGKLKDMSEGWRTIESTSTNKNRWKNMEKRKIIILRVCLSSKNKTIGENIMKVNYENIIKNIL